MWRIKDGLWFDDEFPFRNLVTSRSFGNMRDKDNRDKFFSEKGINPGSVVLAQQIHGNKIAVVTSADKGKIIPEADGLVSSSAGLSLAIFTADCLPVFFASSKPGAAGLIHAGWRGLACGIIAGAVAVFEKEFNVKAFQITASVGPGIGKCCYEVSEDVRSIFGLPPDEKRLDLSEMAIKQLRENGIRRIIVNRCCTFHQKEMFFSYRRDKTDGRMMSLISR